MESASGSKKSFMVELWVLPGLNQILDFRFKDFGQDLSFEFLDEK